MFFRQGKNAILLSVADSVSLHGSFSDGDADQVPGNIFGPHDH